jgi:hypothetical protein
VVHVRSNAVGPLTLAIAGGANAKTTSMVGSVPEEASASRATAFACRSRSWMDAENAKSGALEIRNVYQMDAAIAHQMKCSMRGCVVRVRIPPSSVPQVRRAGPAQTQGAVVAVFAVMRRATASIPPIGKASQSTNSVVPAPFAMASAARTPIVRSRAACGRTRVGGRTAGQGGNPPRSMLGRRGPRVPLR